ncbi:hypothetical protein PVMG_06166 [Plasmodium vivax Mauritania I]|uniref:Uncharacterized protein n=1 Tax=Plasmodium vivax Mauritania I TaxID=1035515 RepID=A0A0J9T4A8_PLAVI|nr:hypothetical protein PVMG_06166 [Plasmodium vivax Mauritania I]
MNFCLNYKLTSPAHNETQKLKFYEKLASKYSNFKAESILKNGMSVMDDKYYNNMSIVYKLYKTSIVQQTEKIQNVTNSWKILKNFITMDYKNATWMYNDLKDLISVHYNLLLEYKEEEENCLMIRILYQFFHYCNDYKYNRKLSLFMEKFINEYYNNNKSKYQKKIQECKSIPNLNPYCELYNKLSAEYKNNFSLIEKNSDRYIEQQKKYIENWSPLDLFILKAKVVFKDFDAMSRILPTIMFTMYDFFDNILTYVKETEKVEGDASSDNEYDECHGFSRVHVEQHVEEGKKVCEHFIKLYNSLPNIKKKGDPNYEKDLKFLNYWLNFKLIQSRINETTCVNNFASLMEGYLWGPLPSYYSSDFAYNIKEEDLNKMNILYNLYKNYSKIQSALQNEPCKPEDLKLDCSNECFLEYKLHRSRCRGVQNKFCKELETFKTNYENLYEKVEAKGKDCSKFFKRLPENENSNIISISLLGSGLGSISLFGILYKVKELNIELLILYRIYQINCYNSLLL